MGALKELYTEQLLNVELINLRTHQAVSAEEFLKLDSLKTPQPEQIHFFGDLQCGFPSPATDYIERGLDLHNYVVKKPAATFFMRAKGDSMVDAGIYPEDILVIDRSITPLSGHIVVASLNGEFTLKRLSYHFGKPILIAENKKYKAISVNEESDFQIFGVLTFNLHQHLK